MLEKLSIKNFQSHKDSILEFDEGVNTITGTSDHGKSSIFRVLNLICKNKPEGNSFVSNWLLNDKNKLTGDTECSLTCDGKTITRVKGKSNKYFLDNDEFSAFGRDVPEPIEEFLSIDNTNIQHQSDNFYLLNLPSTQVAEELNKLVNLEIIDQSVYNINSKINKIKSDIVFSQTRSNDFLNNLEFYNDIDQRELVLNKLYKKNLKLNEISSDITTLNNSIKKTKEIIDKIKAYDKIIEFERPVTKLSELATQILNVTTKQINLFTLKNKITGFSNKLEKLKIIIELEENYKKHFANTHLLNKYKFDIAQLKKIIESITENQKIYKQTIQEIIKFEEIYNQLFPDVCPLCGLSKNEIHTNC